MGTTKYAKGTKTGAKAGGPTEHSEQHGQKTKAWTTDYTDCTDAGWEGAIRDQRVRVGDPVHCPGTDHRPTDHRLPDRAKAGTTDPGVIKT